MNSAADPDAGKNGYVVISKDEDFIRWQRDVRNSPRFVWVRTGNCKNKELIDAIPHLLLRLSCRVALDGPPETRWSQFFVA